MSPQPHREKDAKVEERDPPEKAKETMAPFRDIMRRLLKVTPDEVVEQQRFYDEAQDSENTLSTKRKKRKKLSVFEKLDEVPRTSTLTRR